MIWIAAALGALVGLIIGWSQGATWAYRKTRQCEDCGCDRVCPKCKKLAIIA